MKKSFLILICVMAFSYVSYGQQDSEYTQYMFNKLVINPSYAGSLDAFSTTAIYRHQWAGMDGAPRTFSINAHAPFGEHSGIGGYIENDKIGVHNRFSLFGSYAYRLDLGNAGQLSLGLQAGVQHYRSNWTEANALDPDDIVLADDYSKLMPNFGLGALYYADNYYIGLGIPHLINNKLDNVTKEAHQFRHYFLGGGMMFDAGTNLKILPSVLLKSVPGRAPLEADLNIHFLLRDALWLGVGYRTADALAFLLEYQFVNGLRLGYAYDLTLTKLGPFNSGTHEVMLGWDIFSDGSNPSRKIISPRFF